MHTQNKNSISASDTPTHTHTIPAIKHLRIGDVASAGKAYKHTRIHACTYTQKQIIHTQLSHTQTHTHTHTHTHTQTGTHAQTHITSNEALASSCRAISKRGTCTPPLYAYTYIHTNKTPTPTHTNVTSDKALASRCRAINRRGAHTHHRNGRCSSAANILWPTVHVGA